MNQEFSNEMFRAGDLVLLGSVLFLVGFVAMSRVWIASKVQSLASAQITLRQQIQEIEKTMDISLQNQQNITQLLNEMDSQINALTQTKKEEQPKKLLVNPPIIPEDYVVKSESLQVSKRQTTQRAAKE